MGVQGLRFSGFRRVGFRVQFSVLGSVFSFWLVRLQLKQADSCRVAPSEKE